MKKKNIIIYIAVFISIISFISYFKYSKEKDVSTAVAFLAADSADSITGTSLMVDGGWTAK